MPRWMRYIVQEGADDGTGAGAGGGGGGVGDAGGATSPGERGGGGEPGGGGGPPAVERPASETGSPDQTADGMLDAIAKGLERSRDPATGKFIAGSEKPAVGEPAKQPEKQPQAPAQKQDAQPKPGEQSGPRKADDFALKAEEKAFTPNAQQRIREMHREWKAAETRFETERAAALAHTEALEQARDQIMGTLEQAQCGAEELGALLEFNFAVKTGRYDQALAMLDEQRAAIAKLAGKEVPGVDLLREHADLAARVEKQELSREDALELARGRNNAKAREQDDARRDTAQQGVREQQQARTTALTALDSWCLQKSKADPAYAAKEAALMAKPKDATGKEGPSRLERIIQRYPPHLWQQRFEEEYDALQLQPAASNGAGNQEPEIPGAGANTPLRSSGAKGGARAPQSYEEAVATGLGYQHTS